MSDKKKGQKKSKDNKDKYYFKIIPKEEYPKFLERLKDALEKTENKKGDKKSFEFEIRGTKEELNGFSLEIFTFDEKRYEEFIDIEQDYLKSALYCFSLNLRVKEESGVKVLNEAFLRWKELLENIFKKKFEFFFRSKGKKVSLDCVAKDGKIIKSLLDLGLDFAEYQKFILAFKIGINAYELMHEWEDPNLEFIKMMSIIFYIKSESENFRYLLIALSEALKDVKIDDKSIQKKFNKFVDYLILLNSFNGTKLKIEYDAKTLAGEGNREAERMTGNEEKLKSKISETQKSYFSLVQNFIVPFIQSIGMTESGKAIDLDKISLSLSVPKYQSGLALSLRIPGITKLLEEML